MLLTTGRRFRAFSKIDVGYCSRIMLSHDYSVPKARHGAEVQEQRRRADHDGYNFISRQAPAQ